MTAPSVVQLSEAEPIALARTTVEGYCRAVQTASRGEFWWYYIGLVKRRNVWKPFQDAGGRWWWYVKPWFAWPVDYFLPLAKGDCVHPRTALLGWQYPVAESEANSHVHLNVIRELGGYDLDRIENKKRRHTIRRALRGLDYAACDPSNEGVCEEACEVWNSHVQRTGWNKSMGVEAFRATWAELAGFPGTTVIAARRRDGGPMCAWLITRVIGDTVFIDTLTSHTERLGESPNDGLIFLCLMSAARMGVSHAHYALKSRIASLEAFKQALGFVPHPFPSRLHLRFPIEPILRACRPAIYKRLVGDESWSSPSSPPSRPKDDSP